jgi:maltooligosyltrehalose trehalohydrolase
VAGDNEGYYRDYTGSAADLAETLDKGWFYTGQVSVHAGHSRGTDASAFDPPHFVYCIQNHDQIGNRALGERLNHDIDPDAYRAVSALLLLSPYTPLLFQGQEWAATTPFLFFTDHNPELGKLVTEGRRAEFAHFEGFRGETVPDPQAASTYEASKLRWDESEQGDHAGVLSLYRELTSLRRTVPGLAPRRRESFRSGAVGRDAIAMRYTLPTGEDALVVVNLRGEMDLRLAARELTCAPEGRRWRVVFSSRDERFGGEQSAKEMHALVQDERLRVSGPIAVLLDSER